MIGMQDGLKGCVNYKLKHNKQYKDMKISVVRPANVYGPFDNFDPNNAMVIPSLINRIVSRKTHSKYG